MFLSLFLSQANESQRYFVYSSFVLCVCRLFSYPCFTAASRSGCYFHWDSFILPNSSKSFVLVFVNLSSACNFVVSDFTSKRKRGIYKYNSLPLVTLIFLCNLKKSKHSILQLSFMNSNYLISLLYNRHEWTSSVNFYLF